MGKWITRILILMLVALSSMVAAAQEATPDAVFCGDLAEADCELLQQSSEAMHNLTAATFEFDFQMTFDESGGDEAPQTLTLAGTGSFGNLPAGLRDSMTQPEAMFGMMSQLLDEFQGDLSLTITLPPRLREEFVEKAEGDVPETITLEMRMVDGVGYLNTETLQPFIGQLTGGEAPGRRFSGWIGVDVGQLLGQVVTENPEIIEQLTIFGMNSQTAAIMGDPTAFENAVNIERSIDADGLAVFTVTLDFAGLASDPAFIDLIRSEMEAEGRAVTDAQLEMGLQMMAQAGEALTFSSTQTIDPATGYVHALAFNLSFDGSMLPAHNEDSEGEEGNIPTFTMTVNVSLDNFNDAPPVSAPEDATILPPELLERLSSGMMRGDFGNGSDEELEAATPEATPSS